MSIPRKRVDPSVSEQVPRLILHSLGMVIRARQQSNSLQPLVERSYALNFLRQAIHFEPSSNATMRAIFSMAIFEVISIFPLLKEVYIANGLIVCDM